MLPLSVYKRVFASSPVGEYLLSRELRILDVNDALLRIIGRTREDLIGCDFFEIFPSDSGEPQTARPSLRASLQDVLDNALVEPSDHVYSPSPPCIAHRGLRLPCPADPTLVDRCIDLVFHPIFNERGEVTGICGQGLDITEKVLVEAELRAMAERNDFRLRLTDRVRAAESSAEIIQAASEMLGCSLQAARVFFADFDEASGTFFVHCDWTDPDAPLPSIAVETYRLDEFGIDGLSVLRRGGTVRVDDMQEVRAQHRTADLLEAKALLQVPILKSARVVLVLCVQHTTPHRWTHEELDKCLDTAERTGVAVEKMRAQDELREANRRKDEFLAMLAHELRNPLAPISAAAQLMQLARLDEAKLKKTSEVISRQVAHMTHLVDDLLDVSRVTRGLVTLNRTPQDLKSIVANAVEQVRPLMEAHHHHLVVEMPADAAHVLGDQKRLVQVFTNLLNNAAKYTPPGGDIRLTTRVDDGHAVTEVCDTGMGIAPSMQKQVFELFAQVERTPDRSQGGLGLGLALVKTLVELHGGMVWCSSEGLGRGSTFTVSLPRLWQAEARVERRHSSREFALAANRRKVLVVDDNADAADMLSLLLETNGHEVAVAHDGEAALAAARAMHPDVCLLDIGLPDMDGNELARRLRARPETARAVLIAVTGYGQEQDRRGSLTAGFDEHLVKPVDPARLAAILDEMASVHVL